MHSKNRTSTLWIRTDTVLKNRPPPLNQASLHLPIPLKFQRLYAHTHTHTDLGVNGWGTTWIMTESRESVGPHRSRGITTLRSTSVLPVLPSVPMGSVGGDDGRVDSVLLFYRAWSFSAIHQSARLSHTQAARIETCLNLHQAYPYSHKHAYQHESKRRRL